VPARFDCTAADAGDAFTAAPTKAAPAAAALVFRKARRLVSEFNAFCEWLSFLLMILSLLFFKILSHLIQNL
jgi:hypothetical protein